MQTPHRNDLPKDVIIIRKFFYWVRHHYNLIFLFIFILFLVFSLIQATFVVNIGGQAVILRFGKLVNKVINPGLHFKFPWGIDHIYKMDVQAIRRLDIINDTKNNNPNKFVDVLSGDESIAYIQLNLQYKIKNLSHYLFNNQNSMNLFYYIARASLTRASATLYLADMIASSKEQFQDMLLNDIRKELTSQQLGIDVLSANLVAISPPIQAIPAFRDVVNAKENMKKSIKIAENYRFHVIGEATGQAMKIIEEASATADVLIQQAIGKAKRFDVILAEKKSSPEQTYISRYREMVQTILYNADVMILTPDKNGKIDINLLEVGSNIPPYNNEKSSNHKKQNSEENSSEKIMNISKKYLGFPMPETLKTLKDRVPGEGLHASQTDQVINTSAFSRKNNSSNNKSHQ